MSTDDVKTIEPLSGPLSGSCVVPGDKSISHRAVLFSAMAEGASRLSGVLDSSDVRASIDAVRKLGAEVSLEKQPDGSLSGGVVGWGAKGPKQPDGPIYCANSGTTARLLMGILAPWDIEVKITGDESLSRRPMRRITAPLMKMGVSFDPAGAETLPIVERGTRDLRAISYDSPMASAQLKTAVLLAGVYANGTTTVNEPSTSRNHTELMLPEFGVETTASELSASVNGPAALKSCEVVVPGDPSSAAFLICAALLKKGSAIQIENVSLNTARTGFFRTLERMGADIEVHRTGSFRDPRSPVWSMRFRFWHWLRRSLAALRFSAMRASFALKRPTVLLLCAMVWRSLVSIPGLKATTCSWRAIPILRSPTASYSILLAIIVLP